MVRAEASLPPVSIPYHVEDGGVVCFTPSMDQFKDFHDFMAAVQPIGAIKGLIKVKAPPNYTANVSHYDLPASFPVHTPVSQHVSGSQGMFRVLAESGESCSVRQFHSRAQRVENNRSAREKQLVIDGDLRSLEECYWKNVGFSNPEYGADSPGSFFDADAPWNMSHLGTLLGVVADRIGGVTTPMLYFGQWKATFAWHVEDMNLYSINYLHFGAAKQWYGIPPAQAPAFEHLVKEHFHVLHRACSQFLRHKDVLIKPSKLRERQIEVIQTVQSQGEFMITFPCCYHQGFNYGFNCAESVNFAPDEWAIHGHTALICRCRSSSVKIDVHEFDKRIEAVKAARKMLIEAASDAEKRDDRMYKRLATVPLSMDLIKAYPALMDALETASNTKTAIHGGRSMTGVAGTVTETQAESMDGFGETSSIMTNIHNENGNSSASSSIPSSPHSDVSLTSASVTSDTTNDDGGTDPILDDADLMLPDEGESDEDYYEEFMPDNLRGIILTCGYPNCDADDFKSKKALLRHYATVHTKKENKDHSSSTQNSERKKKSRGHSGGADGSNSVKRRKRKRGYDEDADDAQRKRHQLVDIYSEFSSDHADDDDDAAALQSGRSEYSIRSLLSPQPASTMRRASSTRSSQTNTTTTMTKKTSSTTTKRRSLTQRGLEEEARTRKKKPQRAKSKGKQVTEVTAVSDADENDADDDTSEDADPGVDEGEEEEGESDDGNSLASDTYMVESIDSHRLVSASGRRLSASAAAKASSAIGVQFLVKWLGHKGRTWEPINNVHHLLSEMYPRWLEEQRRQKNKLPSSSSSAAVTSHRKQIRSRRTRR